MISHKYQCIFMHIPKCAGTSIESALGHLDNHVGRGGQDHRSIRMIEQSYFNSKMLCTKQNLIELVRRHTFERVRLQLNHRNKYSVSSEQYKNYFKFTIVRNPWARAYSCYKSVIIDPIHCKEMKIYREISFKNFLVRFAGKGLLRSQLYWVQSFDGSIPLDFIGRFENLSEDTQKIFKKINLNNVSLPHKLKGSVSDFRGHYDTASNDIIHNIYKEEINIFKYTFE